MDTCPKCGSGTGFTYNLVIKTNRTGDWGLDNDEEVDVEKALFPKTVECIDCGKRTDFETAHAKRQSLIPS